MSPIRFEFVAQTGRVFEDDVDMVIAPGADGILGILPRHAPLMAVVQPGEVVVKQAGQPDRFFVVGGGFIEVRPDKVVLLARSGEAAEDIDVARAEDARQRAEEWLATHPRGAERREAYEAALRRSMQRLRLVQKRAPRHTTVAQFKDNNRPG
jgi:F-type H+-transporting ATPase subunit epsilon